MRRTLAAISLVIAAFAGGAAFAAQRTVTLAVDNVMCPACPYTVKQSLARVAGVSNVVVSFEQKTATVTYDDQKTTLAALTNAATQAGYPSRAVQ